MDTEIAVGGLEQGFEFVEGLRAVDGQSADDAQANAFVDEAIEIGGDGLSTSGAAQFVSGGASFVSGRTCVGRIASALVAVLANG